MTMVFFTAFTLLTAVAVSRAISECCIVHISPSSVFTLLCKCLGARNVIFCFFALGFVQSRQWPRRIWNAQQRASQEVALWPFAGPAKLPPRCHAPAVAATAVARAAAAAAAAEHLVNSTSGPVQHETTVVVIVVKTCVAATEAAAGGLKVPRGRGGGSGRLRPPAAAAAAGRPVAVREAAALILTGAEEEMRLMTGAEAVRETLARRLTASACDNRTR